MVTLIASEAAFMGPATTTNNRPLATDDDLPQQQKRHVRQPEVCVDYLSYKFDEMDLAASWRVMTKQKKQVVDGIRLENASWRTWAKQRNNLKTISPQSLNWLKDSDVTWLYGPLHTVIKFEEDPFLTPRAATTEEQLGLITPYSSGDKRPLKSALKKVSTVDLLKRSISDLHVSPSTADKKAINQKSPTPTSTRHHHRKKSISDMNDELQAVSPAVLATHRQPKLRFNHRVEQCIAIVNDDDDAENHETEADNDEDILTSDLHYASTPSYPADRDRRRSIVKIRSTRLKRSQSDDEEACSSLSSSANTATSSTNFFTQSPIRSYDSSSNSPLQQPHNAGMVRSEGIRDDHGVLERRSSSMPTPNTANVSLTHNYKEKSNIAEPALVTMHQTATDLHRTPDKTDTSNSSLFQHMVQLASTYFWPAKGSTINHKNRTDKNLLNTSQQL